MKRSTLRHPIAVLRVKILEMEWKEFVEICHMPLKTLEGYERMARKLTKQSAIKITQATGISTNWLLDGDPKAIPVAEYLPPKKDENGQRIPKEYTLATYKEHKEKIKEAKNLKHRLCDFPEALDILTKILGAVAAAEKKRGRLEALLLIDDFEQKMTKAFGQDRLIQAELTQKLECAERINDLFRLPEYEKTKNAFKDALRKSYYTSPQNAIFRNLRPLLIDIQSMVRGVRLDKVKAKPLWKPETEEEKIKRTKKMFAIVKKVGEQERLKSISPAELSKEKVWMLSEGRKD